MAQQRDAWGVRMWRFIKSARTRAVLSTGLLLGFGSIGTHAYWSDNAAVSGGAITAGQMDLQFDTNGAVGLGTAYTKSTMTWSGLAPNERKAFPLTVKDVGTPPMTYSATVTRGSTWSFTDPAITVQVFAGSPVADNTYPQQDSCSGSAIGTQQIVGSDTKVVIPPRSLSPGSPHDLCIVVGVASNATNANQGKSGSVRLDFTANQQP